MSDIELVFSIEEFMSLKEVMQILVQPINLQFHLISGYNADFALNVRGMQREDGYSKCVHRGAGV